MFKFLVVLYPPFPDSLATVSFFRISFTLLVIIVLNIKFIVLFLYGDLFLRHFSKFCILRHFSKFCMSFQFVLLYFAVIKVSGLNISIRLALVLYFLLCISWYTCEMIKKHFNTYMSFSVTAIWILNKHLKYYAERKEHFDYHHACIRITEIKWGLKITLHFNTALFLWITVVPAVRLSETAFFTVCTHM